MSRIYMIGNFSAPWCSEVHWAKCLEKLGHEVTRQQEDKILNGTVHQGLPGHDLFLWVRTWEGFVSQRDIDYSRSLGIPSVNIHLDLFVGISREATLDTDPRWRTDFVFTADGDPKSQEIFEAHGINHHWLKAGVFDDACVMFEPNNDPELQGDIIFVGHGKDYQHKEWPYRKQLIEFLEKTYPNQYRKFGHPQRLVREDDLNQLYANAKIVIGDSLNVGFNHPNYWSDRVYETTGRGGFIIHPQITGIQDEFVTYDFKLDNDWMWDKAPAPVELVTYEYNNFNMLKERIDYFLREEKYRKEIQKAGFERTKRDHTYTKRLQEMLDIVFPKIKVVESDKDIIVLGENLPAVALELKINLGAGEDNESDWVNVDMIDLPGIDVVHNLIKFPYPFEDNSADEIKAVDVLEHLPPYIGDEHGVIKFINECHRILKPGGTLYMQTPGWRARFLWIDPTHVRGFDIQSMDFFDPSKHFGQTTGFYSPCKFNVRAEELPNHNLRFWMTKI